MTMKAIILIASLFLIHELNGQTGAGCFFTTCSNPVKIRYDAIIDPVSGDFLGGCYCDCPPTLECPINEIIDAANCVCIADPALNAPAPAPALTNPSPANPSPSNPSGMGAIDPITLSQGFQNAIGCQDPICSNPNMVKVDAIMDTMNNFLGGCYCECPYELFETTSVKYCAPPNAVLDDCSCGMAPPTPPPSNPPATGGSGTGTGTGTGTGAGAGTGAAPASAPPAPATALCDAAATACECPVGTAGECTIECVGPDGCKDSIINCNNDGYDCFVECGGEQSCSGASTINGPANGALTVECTGEVSCEGAMTVNAATGTNLNMLCEGLTSCKSNVLNFGNGQHSVACLGEPGVGSTCIDMIFNLPPNAATTPNMAFACTGMTCPVNAPAPFNNIAGPRIINCDTPGNCGCLVGTKDTCTINCDAGYDACKDGLIDCNNDGFDCIVNCVEGNACAGSSMITGPKRGTLTVNCIGAKACEGAVAINGELSTNVKVVCDGMEACKGNTEYIYGSGIGSLECRGTADTCSGAQTFTMQPGTESRFTCIGNACPPNYPGAAV